MLKSIFNLLKHKDTWEFKLPEHKPEFEKLYIEVGELYSQYLIENNGAFEYKTFLYMGSKEYEIYWDWYRNVVCYLNQEPESKDKLLGLEIKRVNKQSYLKVGEFE